MAPRSTESARYRSPFLAIVFLAACTTQPSSLPLYRAGGSSDMQLDQARQDQIARGRFVVITHDCGGCHGGGSNPAAAGWLDGMRDTINGVFHIGPFVTRPKNLTPDDATGMGRFSERQIFNSLRYGLRPEETPDVDITSTAPGQGNFPLHPHYLAPPMPWDAWRHLPDQDLWAIAAYLKQGLKPSNHKVPDSDGPPDFWASAYTVQTIGPYPALPYPTANEKR